MPSVFDSKVFNGEVFRGYIERLPNPTRTELIKSKAIRPRPELAQAMADQTGGNYMTTSLKGLVSGDPQNYDGTTDMEPGKTTTFQHSRVVVGRMKSWVENDFSHDITGGEDFIENIAAQIAEYWNEVDQGTIIHILKGVFSMTSTEGAKFVNAHTHDVTGKTNSEGVIGCMDGTTLNTGIQRACGDNKGKFSLAIMHSVVATALENLKLLAYLKYTDSNGMERDLAIGTLNGRTVLVDDGMPAEEGYYAATASDAGALKIIASGTAASGEVTLANVKKGAFYPTGAAADAYVVPGTRYTTYVLGDGAIEYTDCGAKVPYETGRDPKTNGGQDTLYSRQRKCFAPYGISFTNQQMKTLSPTDDELENGVNWELVHSQGSDATEYISHKTIPIARILSRG